MWLATRRENKETAYALKTMTKRQLIETEAVQGVLREKQIMASTEHPFILPLVGSFQDESFLYLLMPFNQGGELFNVIHADQHGFAAQLLHAIQHNHADKSGALTEPASQFYGGCLLEALGYLHARNIAYRDLKPENAMLDKVRTYVSNVTGTHGVSDIFFRENRYTCSRALSLSLSFTSKLLTHRCLLLI